MHTAFEFTPEKDDLILNIICDAVASGECRKDINYPTKMREILGGPPFPTREQCRIRVKNLRDKYVRLVAKNNKTGQPPVLVPELLSEAFADTIVNDHTPLESGGKTKDQYPLYIYV